MYLGLGCGWDRDGTVHASRVLHGVWEVCSLRNSGVGFDNFARVIAVRGRSVLWKVMWSVLFDARDYHDGNLVLRERCLLVMYILCMRLKKSAL